MRHQTRARSVCILPLRSAVVNWLPKQPASELLAALRVLPAEVRERPVLRQVVISPRWMCSGPIRRGIARDLSQ